MIVHEHGKTGPLVIVLHGGPAAAGDAAGIARGLARSFRVLEPWQRGSGEEPLTVERHVEDLHDLVTGRPGAGKPALVGHSWGAMLALAYAARHPESAGPLVLVGCGTFDLEARARLQATLDERLGEEGRERLARARREITDPGARLTAQYDILRPLFSYDPLPEHAGEGPVSFDPRAHEETWADMLRLQRKGLYPAAFSAITSPVLMLHGENDPHPGSMIRGGLLEQIPHLECTFLERCGHYPWHERHARERFFSLLETWLLRHAQGGRPV